MTLDMKWTEKYAVRFIHWLRGREGVREYVRQGIEARNPDPDSVERVVDDMLREAGIDG